MKRERIDYKENTNSRNACNPHGEEGKKIKSKIKANSGIEPLGSKYLVRAPSGLRIDILSKGSLLRLQNLLENS